MSDVLRNAIQKATARLEPRRVAGIQRTTPGALGETPRAREALVSDEEIRRQAAAEARDYLRRKEPIDWHSVESKTAAWVRAEELRKVQERERNLEHGKPDSNG